jgi:hypothetical protein
LHTTLRGLSPAGLNFGLFSLFPPTFPLSAQRTLYCYGLGLNHIIPLAWFRRNQATAAQFLPFRSLAFPGNCVPVLGLVSSSLCVSPSLSPSDPTSAIDTRYSNLRTPGSASSSLLAPALEHRAASPRRHIPAAAGITSHAHRPSSLLLTFSPRDSDVAGFY